MPDTAEYLKRMQTITGSDDPVVIQRETPRLLAALIADASEETLCRRPSPNKWSVGEILAHLAEDELVSSWRYRQMIEHSGTSLAGFDQDLWAKLGDYKSWKPADALQMFRLLREANLRMFAGLTPEDWQHHGIHTERGKITIADLVRHMAGHDRNHLAQIRKILNRPTPE